MNLLLSYFFTISFCVCISSQFLSGNFYLSIAKMIISILYVLLSKYTPERFDYVDIWDLWELYIIFLNSLDDFTKVLEENSNLLEDINKCIEPRTHRLESFSQLANDLIEEVDALDE